MAAPDGPPIRPFTIRPRPRMRGRGRALKFARSRFSRSGFDDIESLTDVVAGLVPATPSFSQRKNNQGWPGQARPRPWWGDTLVIGRLVLECPLFDHAADTDISLPEFVSEPAVPLVPPGRPPRVLNEEGLLGIIVADRDHGVAFARDVVLVKHG